MKPLTVLSGVRMVGYMDVMVCLLSRGSVGREPRTRIVSLLTVAFGVSTRIPRNSRCLPKACQIPGVLIFNDMGQGFATCCVIPHLFHIVQGGVYHKQSKQNVNPYVYDNIKTIRDHVHKSAHGGARFYLADVFPEKYRDQLFMCNIHEHAVLIDYMVPKGSSFIGKHGDDFLMANDLAWVGFSVEIGPDGGVYILDWHDQNICGNEIKFANSARVYRIMPKGVKGPKPFDLEKLSDLELVELQNHSNDWYVRQSRTILQHRALTGKLDSEKVHQKLLKMLADAPR